MHTEADVTASPDLALLCLLFQVFQSFALTVPTVSTCGGLVNYMFRPIDCVQRHVDAYESRVVFEILMMKFMLTSLMLNLEVCAQRIYDSIYHDISPGSRCFVRGMSRLEC